jgi:hypothetical protein
MRSENASPINLSIATVFIFYRITMRCISALAHQASQTLQHYLRRLVIWRYLHDIATLALGIGQLPFLFIHLA